MRMKRRLKERIQPFMVRPIIYKTFARFLYALLAALLWKEFVLDADSPLTLQSAFVFLFVLFVAAAWIAYLRLDGAKLPRFPAKRLRLKDRTEIRYGDMPDYIDEPVVSFAELEWEEQDVCLICAEAVNALIFIVLSFFF